MRTVNGEQNAKLVANSVLSGISDVVDRVEYISCEPYWKIENTYKIEMNIVIIDLLTNDQLHSFMNDVADKWLLYGSPTDELLASDTMEGCNYIKQGVSLINFFE